MQLKFSPFWIAPPAGTPGLDFLRVFADRAAGLVDLRFGAADQRLTLANQVGREVTVEVPAGDRELLAVVRKTSARVVLDGAGDSMAQLIAGLHGDGVEVGVEVDSRTAARAAEAAGADFLLASGAEAGGLVSTQTALVLVQAILDQIRIPLVVRASAGPLGTAALLAAGCAACVLDSQLLLAPECPIEPALRQLLSEASPADTRLCGTWAGRGYRFLTRRAPAEAEALADREWTLAAEGNAGAWSAALEPHIERGFCADATLPPVGQGIAFARLFAEQNLDAAGILARYQEARRVASSNVRRRFPFAAGAALARRHRCKLPVFQGPMASISDSPALPVEVARAGALPFVATATLSPAETRRVLAETRAALGSLPFGVGLVRFADPERLDAQVQAIVDCAPEAVTIAGGDSELARRFSDVGITAFLHAPSPEHLRSFLGQGVRNLILEGHESGGHVGALSSLVLWELAVETMCRGEFEVAGSAVLLAGGLGTARGALMAAIMADPLVERGVACGLQLGTAYLLTREAIQCGAISSAAQRAMLAGERTVTTGQTVNLPCRWLVSDALRPLLSGELARRRDGLPMSERKREGERDNFRAMMAGLEGRKPGADPDAPADPSAGPVCCGEIVAAVAEPLTMAGLHEAMTTGAARLAAALTVPGEPLDTRDDAIAVVGIGCVFPGAHSPSEFWDNIVACRCFIGPVPSDHWDTGVYYQPGATDKSASHLGAFLDDFKPDPVKFRIPPSIAHTVDRSQFLALEVAYQALQDAGLLEREFPRARTGVFLGSALSNQAASQVTMRVHWPEVATAIAESPVFAALPPEARAALLTGAERVLKDRLPIPNEDTGPGVMGSLVAGRICHCFDLGGPAFVIDGACASSLAALQAGVESLRRREIDLALVGGADSAVGASEYVIFSRIGALSDQGSFPFDERASGFVMGEGAGMLLLKRWADACRDGDRIYALVRGIGAASDGRVKGITAPDAYGQARAMARAYENTPFGPEDITCIEAHGTSTAVGDKTELTSLTEIFGPGREPASIALGSVKSMIGHLKTAAGIAGLIKTVLALHRRVLPPTMNCEQPRRDVDWASSPFFLNTEARPWLSRGKPRRAGVNSLGFGGINYHVVLEEAPGGEQAADIEEAELPAQLFLFRADTRDRLQRMLAETERRLGEHPEAFIDVALENARASGAGPTVAIVAADATELGERCGRALGVLADETRGEFASASGVYFGARPLGPEEKVAFLFPGQGSQYVDMGGDLPACFSEARHIFDEADAVAQAVVGHGISDLLVCPGLDEDEERRRNATLARADYNHPCLLSLEATLCHLLRRAGVNPDLVAGHSLGEYMALEAAGALDLHAAVVLTAVRGQRIHDGAPAGGSMVIVPGPADRVAEIIDGVSGFVRVANRNCPAQTVIAGDPEGVSQAAERLRAAGLEGVRLEVPSAFHTQLLAGVAESFRAMLDTTPIHVPRLPVQCNLTGTVYDTAAPDFGALVRETLVRHMVSPVDFIGNVESLYAAGARLFVEVGPGSTLSSFVDNILGERPHHTFSTNLRRRSATVQLLHTLAFCAARGLDVDPTRLRARPERRPKPRPVAPVRARKPSAAVTPSGPGDGFVTRALAQVPAAEREAYLRQRGDFLRSMVQLDFQHFSSSAAPAAGDGLERRVIEAAAHKTGYPAETIDLDQDAEADLGLDSIKQVEFVRDLCKELGLPAEPAAKGRRYQLTTLRGLVDDLRARLGGAASVAPVPAPAARPAAVAPVAPEVRTDCHRLVCKPRPAPLATASGKALDGAHLLLLAGENDFSQILAQALERAGAGVTVLACTQAPGHVAEHDVILDLSAFRARDPRDRASWWQQLEQRAGWLLSVAQAVLRGTPAQRRWISATSLGGSLASGPVERPGSVAGIGLGLLRCLAAEHRETLRASYLDFAADLPDAELVAALMAELERPAGHPEVGYTRAGRQEIHWQVDDELGAQTIVLDEQSVILAVGGLRGITAEICRQLATTHPARFVLVGREAPDGVAAPDRLPSFAEVRSLFIERRRAEGKPIVPAELDRLTWVEVWAQERAFTLAALRRAGRMAEFRACDVTDAGSVQRLVRGVLEHYGRIDVVIQGSGALIEKSALDLGPDQFIAGLRPKALGTANLLDALADVPVASFLNLSSVVGRWGHQGLGAYAVGHEIAGILLGGQRGQRTGAFANLLYGPWLDVGMTRQGATMERLRESGSAFITVQDGARYLLGELTSGSNQTTAFADATLLDKGRCPMLDRWTVRPGQGAEGFRRMDPARDRFIADHLIAGEALVPGVASLEMMAQTASLLAEPGQELVECRDFVLERPIRFPRGEAREVKIEARVRADGTQSWFETRVCSEGRPRPDGEVPVLVHGRCRLRFGVRPAPPALALMVPGASWGKYLIDATPLFAAEVSAMQGLFRSPRSNQPFGPDGWTGWVQPLLDDEFGPRPFTDNPLRLDTLLGSTDAWFALADGDYRHYIESIGSIHWYGEADPAASRDVHFMPSRTDTTGMLFDLDAADGQGRVRESFRGLKPAVANKGDAVGASEPIWAILRDSPQCQEMARLLGHRGTLALAELGIAAVEAALDVPDVDAELALRLDQAERSELDAMPHPKRRRDWLAGRMVAKSAVRHVLGRKHAGWLDLRIERGAKGAPRVLMGGTSPAHVSIAHSADVAIAAASDTTRLGVDVERVAPAVEEIADSFCLPGELEAVECEGQSRAQALTSLWTAKEAARKLAGPHACAMTDLRVSGREAHGAYALLVVDGFSTRFRAVVFESQGSGYAIAVEVKP